jgi:hypothetical protein
MADVSPPPTARLSPLVRQLQQRTKDAVSRALDSVRGLSRRA